MLFSELAGRKVGILGAGSEGRSVWRQLRRRYPDLRLELFSEGEVDPAFAAELESCGHPLHRGALADFDLARFEVLVRSPGISPYREELCGARQAGARFTSATNIWFAEHPGSSTICITGTKGKSTTTALTAHLLHAAGIRAGVAGNIGRPLLDIDDRAADWWVVELSSYQLADFEGDPRVAAILNLSDDHLDWHSGRDSYWRDKLRLADRVRGPLVANFADPLLREKLADRTGVRWFNHRRGWRSAGDGVVQGDAPGPGLAMPRCRGRHNLDNLAAALTLAECVTRVDGTALRALESFEGLPHRLNALGKRDGLLFVDDSLSTTPVAVLAALDAFRGERVTLLLGGLDRGVDWGGFAPRLRDCLPHAMIAMPDNGPHILAEIARHGIALRGGMHEADSLEAAVAMARTVTPTGGIVLLSPGAPSFPRFRDYRERGAAFARAAGFEAG